MKLEHDLKLLCQLLQVFIFYQEIKQNILTVDGTLYQIVCEPETFTFKIKTKGKPDRWVDIPLATLLFK